MVKSSEEVVDVEARDETGKNACRRLRVRGQVPGNVYGLDRAPFKVAVSPKRIDEVLHLGSGKNTVFTLRLGGEKPTTREAMIRELQRDPITGKIIHIDFVRVDPNRRIHVQVPIRLIGIPIGVKNDGGVLDFVHRDVEVECLPASIPEHLDVDVSGLQLNQHVSVSDLGTAEGVRILAPPDTIIAVVAVLKIEVTPGEAVAATPAEPEVAKKGKDVEAGAAGKDK
jgi:large subunit ribosomal protein L25